MSFSLLQTTSASTSQVGHVRSHNEDLLLADDELGLWLVADGMGGHASGEVASRIAVEHIRDQLNQGLGLPEAIESAHRAILQAAEENPAQNGMGTTIVAARRRAMRIDIAWVGDSRSYQITPTRPLTQLTEDHSFVQDMVLRGVLTEQEAKTHPQKNLIHQALGMTTLKRLVVDQRVLTPMRPGRLLLCSDGVSDMLDLKTLRVLLGDLKSDLNETADRLKESVLATEAEDNFSFILIDYRLKGLFG